MKILALSAVILAVCVASAEQKGPSPVPQGYNSVGFFPIAIKPGTNTVENLPFTATYHPRLKSLGGMKPGDTISWDGESHTFDGKTWSGKNGGIAEVPVEKKFTIVRTANETTICNIGGELDVEKAMKQQQTK